MKKVIKKIYNLVVLAFFLVYLIVLLIFMKVLIIFCKFLNVEKINNFIIDKSTLISINIFLTLCEPFFPVPIVVRYDKLVMKLKRNIVISNHVYDFDWIYILAVFYRFDRIEDIKFIMKKELYKVPLLGPMLEFQNHFFINRENKLETLNNLKEFLNRMKNKKSYSICIFPEGTYPYTEVYNKSISFSKKFNHQIIDYDRKFCRKLIPFIPENILFPKTSGFNTLVESLVSTYDGLIDITLFINPYMFTSVNDIDKLDILLGTNKNISYFINIECHSNHLKNTNEKDRIALNEEFLINSFLVKERNIEKYKNIFNSKFISNDLEIISFLESLGNSNFLTKKSDMVIDIIRIKSKYKHLIYFIMILSYFLAFKLIFRLISRTFNSKKDDVRSKETN